MIFKTIEPALLTVCLESVVLSMHLSANSYNTCGTGMSQTSGEKCPGHDADSLHRRSEAAGTDTGCWSSQVMLPQMLL